MNEEFFNYDVWTDSNGNIAYLQVNIDPDNMTNLEEQFTNKHPRKEEESDEAYIERFIEFLLEDDNTKVNVINRPDQSIMVHQ